MAYVGGFGFFFNAMARVVFSSLQDKFGFKKIYFILISIQVIELLLIIKTKVIN